MDLTQSFFRILPKLSWSPRLNRSFTAGLKHSCKGKGSVANFAVIHRWRHHRIVAMKSNVCAKPSYTYFNHTPLTIPYHQNVSSFITCHCLHEKKPSHELDVSHIEKELAAENKLSKRRKRTTSDLQNSMVNVGKFVTDKILELLDEDGTSLGTVNRNQAIALSQEKKLKLVLLKPGAKPWPVYKLMTGQELHEEQVKRNEKVKKRTAPTQLKELKASWNIGQHDIDVRRRHLENWFSDEHANIHARVTVTGGRGTEVVPQEKQLAVVKQLLSGLEDRLTLNGPHQMMGRNMSTLKVTIRAMSQKEKAAYRKSNAENNQSKSE